MRSRILVTGGAGFIGSGVVHALLDRGDEVVVYDSGVAAGYAYVEHTSAMIIKGDIRNPGALERSLQGCGAVVHLAAQANVSQSIADPLDDHQINVGATLSLLEAARRRDIKRIVFASSNAVIGGHPPPAHEGLVPYPVSPYGAAKAAVEGYLQAYHEAYGLEGVALRFANAYGPRAAHTGGVVAAFVMAYLSGGPLIIRGTGHQTRDFVYVDDVIAMVLASLDAPSDMVANEVFEVGTGVETSLIELARLLFEAGGAEVSIEHSSPSSGDVPRNVSDISKARAVLGYSPMMSLRDGLGQTLAWSRENSRV